MYDPLFRLCLLRTQNRLAYQYLLVEVQGAETTTLVLWASIVALTVVIFGSYWIVPGLAVFADLMQAAVAFLLWRYSEYLAAITLAAKRSAFQTSEVNLVEIIRSEVVSNELGMAR